MTIFHFNFYNFSKFTNIRKTAAKTMVLHKSRGRICKRKERELGMKGYTYPV
jgi:hypothetical protein